MRPTFFILIFCSTMKLFSIPEWMENQIASDLDSYQPHEFCQECISQYYQTYHSDMDRKLCLFKIRSGQLSYEIFPTFTSEKNTPRKLRIYIRALEQVLTQVSIPDTEFIVSLFDAFQYQSPVPVFTMCRKKNVRGVLLPDYEALAEKFQVIKDLDLVTTDYPLRWDDKVPTAVWRGGFAEGSVTRENKETKSRYIACNLSQLHPELIDAGYNATFRIIPDFLKHVEKKALSYDAIFSYKYQLWLDGHATSYSASGWRFYTHSCVIKPASPYMQWYFADMKPWIHYVPVRKDLSDLIEIILFLRNNDAQAEQIARNGIKFIREHISPERNFEYLQALLNSYISRIESPQARCPIHS